MGRTYAICYRYGKDGQEHELFRERFADANSARLTAKGWREHFANEFLKRKPAVYHKPVESE
jgi:hypothetical protein